MSRSRLADQSSFADSSSSAIKLYQTIESGASTAQRTWTCCTWPSCTPAPVPVPETWLTQAETNAIPAPLADAACLMAHVPWEACQPHGMRARVQGAAHHAADFEPSGVEVERWAQVEYVRIVALEQVWQRQL